MKNNFLLLLLLSLNSTNFLHASSKRKATVFLQASQNSQTTDSQETHLSQYALAYLANLPTHHQSQEDAQINDGYSYWSNPSPLPYDNDWASQGDNQYNAHNHNNDFFDGFEYNETAERHIISQETTADSPVLQLTQNDNYNPFVRTVTAGSTNE